MAPSLHPSGQIATVMCPEQSTLDSKIYCRAWIERLDSIHAAIPAFATWRIDELAGLFEQYNAILQQAGSDQRIYRKCSPLVKNLDVISLSIEKASRDRNWLPFNRAALEMGWDIEILRDILSVYI